MNDQFKNKNFVIQCKNCRTILGDSSNYNNYDKELGIITFKFLVNFKINNTIPIEENNNFSEGSTFLNLCCNQCFTSIGRIYKSVNSNLTNYKNLYTLNFNSITTYELKKIINEEENKQKEDKNVTLIKENENEINNLKIDFTKIQKLLLLHGNEISTFRSLNNEVSNLTKDIDHISSIVIRNDQTLKEFKKNFEEEENGEDEDETINVTPISDDQIIEEVDIDEEGEEEEEIVKPPLRRSTRKKATKRKRIIDDSDYSE